MKGIFLLAEILKKRELTIQISHMWKINMNYDNIRVDLVNQGGY